jgi:trimeric autotransporter adhesin
MRPLYLVALIPLLVPHLAQSQTAPVISASPTSISIAFTSGGTLPRPQTLSLTSTPSPATVNLSFSSSSGGAWLDVAPISGTTPAMISVSVDPFAVNLAVGTYNGTITVNQTLKIPVTLTVTTALVPSSTSLTFTAQQVTGSPTPAPPVQTLNVTSGVPAPFSAAATSTGNWLVVSPASGTTPANLTVSVNPAGLAPGTYMGSVGLSSGAAPPMTVQVTLTVQPPLMFTLSATSLNFVATSAVPQPPTQTISVFSNLPTNVVPTATTNSGNAWLTVTQNSGQTPLTLTVSVAAGLVQGPHTGMITLSTTRPGPVLATIPVSYTVDAPQSPTLLVSPDTLNFSSAQGGLPIQQAIAVSNTGGGALPYSAQITAQSGGNWLTLQSTTGTATAGTPGSIPFTINPGTLTPGAYSATVTVTGASQTATALIVLSISAQAPSLLLSQTGLVFSTVAQAANPPTQTVSVVNTGSGTLNWNVTASTLSGGNWLSATPTSGSTQPLPTVPPTVGISVNSQGLAAGTYFGSVKVNTQVISVQTTVLPAGQTPSPSLTTNGMVITAVAGTTNAQRQGFSVINPLPFTIATSTDDGANWLAASSSDGITVTVQTTLTSLTPGIRHGTIRLGFSDGSVQTVNVLSVVAPAGTAPQTISANALTFAASGCPSVLLPQMTSLSSNFTANASQSVPLSVTVVDDCGHALANSTSSSVIASFYDATKPPGPSAKLQPDQRLTPQGGGVWSGTWTPQSATAQTQVIIVALGINGTTPIAGQSVLNGTVHAAGAGSPALPFGIFNAASYQPGNSVALGSFVSIFGANMADGSGAPSTQPLPTNYQGTQVFLGGVALPLQYAGPNQINALIPANVAVDSEQPLVVQRDLTQAAPTSVTIADAQPGIYTANQQGTGQGAVLTSDNSLDAPTGAFPGAHPATRGDYIQIYCTGLGAVTNPPASGAAAPNAPLSSTVNTVTASIGGINAPVLFSGLAPGFIGLYQVNVTVPAGAPVGGAVPLTLSVGSATSNTATVAIQ